ncbi:ran-binding protein 3-like [Xenia sp. Carnegie-2017]|uniref:ran-binding protein 3-like n=1 Tax=Xenia sp. Carnegie-2017 TaxID=2897299 RepID=UPI001F038FEC|nr:ran-binding protein 3-like [Xenia sp. Carnegie-2017]
MAEVTSSSAKEGFSTVLTVSTSCSVPVVAPPKFVFGKDMSNRVKQNDNDDSDTSEKEDEQSTGVANVFEHPLAAIKRFAESDDEDDEFSCSDLNFLPKKIMKTEATEQTTSSVLRPSALSAIADKLSHPKQQCEKVCEKVQESDIPAKTCGESSNSNSNLEVSTSLSRPTLIDTPASINIESQPPNYFQQFLSGLSSSTSESKDSFVFGQNISDRVNVNASNEDSCASLANRAEEGVASPKSLSDVADSAGKDTNTNSGDACSSIALAAQKYESEHSSSKKNLAEIQVMTGEEDERSVVQVSCRLFVFCKEKHSWLGRGRVLLKLNDQCKINEDGTIHSRLVARTQGNLRLVLNTKLWSEMVLEKASDKALRVSAMEDGNVNLYLIMVAPREATQLYTAIDRRIATLKSQKSTIKSTSDDLTASGEQETICANSEDENKEIKNKFITGDVTLTDIQEETNKEHIYNAEKLPATLPDKPI